MLILLQGLCCSKGGSVVLLLSFLTSPSLFPFWKGGERKGVGGRIALFDWCCSKVALCLLGLAHMEDDSVTIIFMISLEIPLLGQVTWPSPFWGGSASALTGYSQSSHSFWCPETYWRIPYHGKLPCWIGDLLKWQQADIPILGSMFVHHCSAIGGGFSGCFSVLKHET